MLYTELLVISLHIMTSIRTCIIGVSMEGHIQRVLHLKGYTYNYNIILARVCEQTQTMTILSETF